MEIVIIGAGEVGTTIARNLSASHNVAIIDLDSDLVEQIKYQIDVLTLVGDGTSLDTLEAANVSDADLVLACTDEDLANLVACGTAKTIGNPFTIARTKSVTYFRTWERDQTAFGADLVVCSDKLTAETIVRIIGLPEAISVEPFAGGLVHMAELEIERDSPVTGLTVAEADHFDSLTFAGLFRDDELILPSGSTLIEANDRAVVIGSPESVRRFACEIAPEDTPDRADEIVIIGGSDIGFHIATLLEKHDLDPRLIEEDQDRARELAEALPNTLVMQHEGTDTEFLSREHVDEADIVIAALDSDEENLLTSLLAKQLGCPRVVSVVERGQYVPIFEEIGIDVAVNPREETAEEIIRFSFESPADNLAVLEHDKAEVVELELSSESVLVGKTIQSLDEIVDGRFVIGAITRDRAFVIPRGGTAFQAGDHIIAFVEPPVVKHLVAIA